jgi:hypothetical protein
MIPWHVPHLSLKFNFGYIFDLKTVPVPLPRVPEIRKTVTKVLRAAVITN